MMDEQKAKVVDEKRNVTGKISDTCRFVGFGLLAIFYAIKIGDSTFALEMQKSWRAVYVIGIFGFLSILLDYLQYFFASFSVQEALKTPGYVYNKKAFTFQAWNVLFWLKQIAVLIGVLALGWLIITT